MKLGARELIIDSVKLMVGVLNYAWLDLALGGLGVGGFFLSLAISTALTLALSYALLNQSSVRFVLSDEEERLPLSGPTHDLRIGGRSTSSPYVLTLHWSGTGPFARRLADLALAKGMALTVDIPSSMATLIHELGDGEQGRSAIRYSASEVEGDTWLWTQVSVATYEIPATPQSVGIAYRREFTLKRWHWLKLFVHLDPDITSIRLIRSTT